MRNLLKTTLIVLSFTLAYGFGYGQTTINFDDAGKWTAGSVAIGSYASDHVYTDGFFSATGGPALRQGTAAQDGFPGALGTYSWRLRDVSTVEWIAAISSGGVSDFSLKLRRWDGSPSPDFNLDYSINGGSSWTTISTINNTSLDNSSDWKTFGGTINSANTNILIRIKANGTTERIMVDDFAWTGYTPSGNQNPAISNITQNPAQLIQSSTTVSISANITDTDGTVEIVELRWGLSAVELGNTIAMTSQGGDLYTTTTSIPAHYNGTTIYYAVYAEDNDGGSATSSTQNYMVSPVVSLETFDIDLGENTTYSVAGDNFEWLHSSASGNGFAQMNGFGSDTIEADWLILPSINLSAQDLVLSFDTWKRYGVTNESNYLKLYYSTTYSGVGNPEDFTWTELSFTQPAEEQVWVSSGQIDLSAIEGENVYIGFEYRYSVGNYVQWRVDNVQLEKKTYTFTFNVVDGTNPNGTDPIDLSIVDFYNIEKQTNEFGAVTYDWVEPEEDLLFSVSKNGYHNFNGLVNVNKNSGRQVRLLSTKVAVNVIATPDINSAIISWDGEGAESYGIYYYEPNTQKEYYVTSNSSPKTILVSPSTTYTLQIRSLVNGVWSFYSNPISFTTLAGTPVVADNIQVSNITSSSAEVSWTGEGATSYAIYYYDLNSSVNFYVTSTSSPKTISVSPETTYGLRVRSLVNGQWSSYSSPINFTSLAGTPIIATNISVNNITSSTAQVSWIGSGAEAYGIYYYDINTSRWNYTSSTTSPANIIVTPETTYSLMVKTKVNGQWSPYTSPVQFTTPSGEQVLATNVSVNNITTTSADVSWLGSGAEWYFVYYVETGTSNYYYKYSKSSPTTITLEPEKNYSLMIRTRIDGRWSSYTPPINFSTGAGAKSLMLSNNTEVEETNFSTMLYPNPAKEYVYLKTFTPETADVKVYVYDIRGALVKSEVIHNQVGEVNSRIELNSLNRGVYIVKVGINSRNEVIRLIVD